MFKIGKLIKNIKKLLPEAVLKKLPKEIMVKEIAEREALRLNKKYRRKNKPANVLSFRYGPDYGEILVCSGIIRKEAKRQGNSYQYQMTRMIAHGMLHLGGLHHEKSQKTQKKAEKIENEILLKLAK